MKKTSVVFAALAAILSPGVLHAQDSTDTDTATSPFSGSVAVLSDYSDFDGFTYNDEPAVELDASLDVFEGISAFLLATKGITQNVGDELDIGISYTKEVAPSTEISVWVGRDIIRDEPDITEFGGSLTHGPFSAEITYYAVDNDADALRMMGSWTLPVSDRLELRGLVVYETGFGLNDIALGGVEGSYALSDRWSIEARYMHPVIRTQGDPRTNQLTVGFRWSF